MADAVIVTMVGDGSDDDGSDRDGTIFDGGIVTMVVIMLVLLVLLLVTMVSRGHDHSNNASNHGGVCNQHANNSMNVTFRTVTKRR